MKHIQELIHTNAHNAFGIGVKTERERIIKLLQPFTEHIDSCYVSGELACYPDDCSCFHYEHAIRLIKGEDK